MKKLIITISILLGACVKTNMEPETWVVWRWHDRVKEPNHAWFCEGHIEGTKTLYRDPSQPLNVYLEAIDSIIIHHVVPDSVDRDYIKWKHIQKAVLP